MQTTSDVASYESAAFYLVFLKPRISLFNNPVQEISARICGS